METEPIILPHTLHLLLVILPAVTALCATAALFLNFYQSRRNDIHARASTVANCLKEFAGDPDIQRAFYAIEYGEFAFNSDFLKSERERDIDKLLRLFANLALSWKGRLLTTRDIRPIQYYILRVMTNPEIVNYMRYIDSLSAEAKVGRHPYSVLGELSQELARTKRAWSTERYRSAATHWFSAHTIRHKATHRGKA